MQKINFMRVYNFCGLADLKRVALWMAVLATVCAAPSDSGVLVEEYSRTVDRYFFFTRVVDTLTIRNVGQEKDIRGTLVPEVPGQYLRYSDALGRVHTHARNYGMHILGFRYPVKPSEAISFTVDRLGWWTTPFVPVFPEGLCSSYAEEQTSFPFWSTRRWHSRTLQPVGAAVKEAETRQADWATRTEYRRAVAFTALLALVVHVRARRAIGQIRERVWARIK